ncbi:GDSL-type esterase/lipase family protein [Hoyosella subflava]|nr:GDSL-type esterase/lipase family protein [Hoyosella subflava]
MEHWVASWTACPSGSLHLVDPSLRTMLALYDQTFRCVVTPHRGGSTLRIHLTNRFRRQAIELASVTVAKQTVGAAIDPETLRAVPFGGHRSIRIPEHADVVSDAVELSFGAFEPLAVSVHVPGTVLHPTGHLEANATSYYSRPLSGCSTADADGGRLGMRTTSQPFVSGIDVLAPQEVSAVVAFGDSITDGFVGSRNVSLRQERTVVDRNLRYPDFLQRRIDAAGVARCVVNAGISGNRVVRDGRVVGFGPSAIARVQQDAIEISGVSDVIVQVGTNDFGLPPRARPKAVIDGYEMVIDRLRDAGIRVHLGTLLPAGGALVHDRLARHGSAHRVAVNEWIRSQTSADSVIDFDAALRDPQNPDALAPDYACPDRLHPNAAGYEAMANAVDLTVLGGS